MAVARIGVRGVVGSGILVMRAFRVRVCLVLRDGYAGMVVVVAELGLWVRVRTVPLKIPVR